MRSILAGFVTAAVVFLGLLALRPVPVAAARAGDDARAFLQAYCITCHSQQMKSRGSVPVALDTLDASAVANDAKTWEAGRPEDARRRHAAGRHAASRSRRRTSNSSPGSKASSIAPRASEPNPGRTEAFHRLNRTEYQNAVRDLLDLDVDVTGCCRPTTRATASTTSPAC